jgi:hypothetical protein
MNFKAITFLMIFLLPITACANGSLTESIYSYARHGDPTESATAFAALAHMALVDIDIDEIIQDYEKEKDPLKRYYYEYLLTARLQQTNYKELFVKHSIDHLNVLAFNDTNWVSIASPFYQQLAYYISSDDEALFAIFKLLNVSDGANLSILIEDLYSQYQANPERFSLVAKSAGVKESDILDLFKGAMQ